MVLVKQVRDWEQMEVLYDNTWHLDRGRTALYRHIDPALAQLAELVQRGMSAPELKETAERALATLAGRLVSTVDYENAETLASILDPGDYVT